MEWIACLAVHAQYLNAQMGNAGNNDAGTGKGHPDMMSASEGEGVMEKGGCENVAL